MDEFDLVVIGGGSAGCALAARLAADGRHSVLLLEAGKSDRDIRLLVPALSSGAVLNPAYDWCYRTEPDDSVGGRTDTWPGGKRLGGGSAINGMVFIRGHRWDYDRWAELGAAGWDYESVLPYFRRLEDNERGADDWRGAGGPLAVSEGRAPYPIERAWIEAAMAEGLPRSNDVNGELAEGIDFVQVSQRRGLRCSTATAYLRNLPAEARPAIALEAQVVRIDFEQGRAKAVVYVQRGIERRVRARAGVVLSAGAMNSPRLLMLSGLGPAEHLAEMGIAVVGDLPGVGGNLQEHAGTHLINDVAARTINEDARGWRAGMQALQFAFARRGILTTAISHVHAFIRSRPGLPSPNLQIGFNPFAFGLDQRGKLALRDEPSVSTLVALTHTSHRGRITLRSSDPFAAPRIEHRLLGDDDDVEQLVEGLGIARRIVAQPAMARFVTGEVRPGPAAATSDELREHVRKWAIPLFHPVGTCRVGGATDALAVVDPELRVRGVDGLWVADASIMPTLPSGNTNATAVMIGEKASDHILRALRSAG